MPIDTGILDRCYYFEDGTPWWTSNDIRVTGPDPAGLATRPTTGSTLNTVRVNIRRKGPAEKPPCYDPIVDKGRGFLRVDLYVCNPTTSPFGPSDSNVKRIRHAPALTGPLVEIELGAGFAPPWDTLPAPGSNKPVDLNWRLPEDPATPHQAEASGHQCLIARVYTLPHDKPTSVGSFHNASAGINLPVDDQHYAQRNICINYCTSPCGVDVEMINADEALPRTFQLRLVQDFQPSAGLMAVITESLRDAGVEDFRIGRERPRRGFGLNIKDMPNVRFVDDKPPDFSPPAGYVRPSIFDRIFGRRAPVDPNLAAIYRRRQELVEPIAMLTPSQEARITLAPGQRMPFRFETDLDGESAGTVHVFHVMEIETGMVVGGVTMLMVKR